ncbi:TraR/DksA family transcriptional regulator [Patescibacteria group bacterium]|nr:TraR/DksA family transcriptional regulator [Patescibacteria group bacterium]
MLTEKEMQALKEQLEKEAGELDAEVARHSKTPDFGDDVEGEDMSEEADEAEETGNELGITTALKERLAEIEHALGKIDSKEYGKCEQCGKAIPLEVLKIDPESRLCKACKQKK